MLVTDNTSSIENMPPADHLGIKRYITITTASKDDSDGDEPVTPKKKIGKSKSMSATTSEEEGDAQVVPKKTVNSKSTPVTAEENDSDASATPRRMTRNKSTSAKSGKNNSDAPAIPRKTVSSKSTYVDSECDSTGEDDVNEEPNTSVVVRKNTDKRDTMTPSGKKSGTSAIPNKKNMLKRAINVAKTGMKLMLDAVPLDSRTNRHYVDMITLSKQMLAELESMTRDDYSWKEDNVAPGTSEEDDVVS